MCQFPPGADVLSCLIGRSEVMRQLRARIRKIARLDVPVLLVGESGTGKELVARAIHDLSDRREKPYVTLNAAAVPVGLVESEFFGHEAGAFTGADRRGRRGKFELAHEGTLFLDEVGDMPVDIQVKLLRVLEDGRFERLGGHRLLQADFRLVCASHRDFARLAESGRFRHDLYYRISGITLQLPPLRARPDDVPDLVDAFLPRFARRHGTPVRRVHPAVYEHLQSMPWPGNVRQLRHAVEHAAVFAEGDVIDVIDFPPSVALTGGNAREPVVHAGATVRRHVGEVEAALIRAAMHRHGGNKKRVAEVLGISRSYLYKRLAEGVLAEQPRLAAGLPATL